MKLKSCSFLGLGPTFAFLLEKRSRMSFLLESVEDVRKGKLRNGIPASLILQPTRKTNMVMRGLFLRLMRGIERSILIYTCNDVDWTFLEGESSHPGSRTNFRERFEEIFSKPLSQIIRKLC